MEEVSKIHNCPKAAATISWICILYLTPLKWSAACYLEVGSNKLLISRSVLEIRNTKIEDFSVDQNDPSLLAQSGIFSFKLIRNDLALLFMAFIGAQFSMRLTL